jgi:hypothetical protein
VIGADPAVRPRRRAVRPGGLPRLREDDDQRERGDLGGALRAPQVRADLRRRRRRGAGNIDSIKLELAENDLLYGGLPRGLPRDAGAGGQAPAVREPDAPRRADAHRVAGDTIVLPTIKGSAASGAILTARGIDGRGSRGMKHKRPDGTQQRPDFVIIDDPQTDESARPPSRSTSGSTSIRKGILKLGGHNRKIAGVMNATVIRPATWSSSSSTPRSSRRGRASGSRWCGSGRAHETLWLGDYASAAQHVRPRGAGRPAAGPPRGDGVLPAQPREDGRGLPRVVGALLRQDTELSAIQHAYNS